jgi:predicted MFS family arabinose efflux permease
VLGPAGGGALIEALSWRAIFWVNIPLIAVTVALTLHSVRESRDRSVPRHRLARDRALGGGAAPVRLRPDRTAQPRLGRTRWSGCRWSRIACFGLFVAREARARHPMLDLALFRIRNFWVANLTTLTAYAGLIGGLFFVGLFLQQVAGYSRSRPGWRRRRSR